ncbi:MAG: glucosaminidase domain-containing protein [Saprospiraceae bacterium]|nr:glucosaminidase domain-containing protein [Saprospiraceae bacterium]MBK8668106.1 glucosaminidase domain-containing protein [Saprospiraceae bacterium]MBL0100104.1 glucosaminidase domain-containing protein [Saprospiraceae bacterium]
MSFIRVFLLFISIGLLSSFDFNPEIAASEYIEAYKDLAVVEMYRTGIPASITLAQGLHESNYGTSKLATEANNHFGIKCKSYWTGKTYYHKDDDYNTKGQITESCFRAYDSDIDSYIDRSNFLMQTERYIPLFSFDKKDFTSWAYGLKYCGYATDDTYTQKLISKIEKYQLHQFDSSEDPFRQLIKH